MPSSQSVVPASEVSSGITPRLLTVKQAAAYSGATVWAIRQLYWAKEIAGTIIGRRLLISRESLDALIDQRLAVHGGVQ
jgi:excisionase family DNA binding protein